jgi:23S rRNA (cytidine1920-2'-O)/16S rRNA (cytidine1409-2'-O)-methyltransferase
VTPGRGKARLVPLVKVLARERPDIADPEAAIAAMAVRVDGTIVTNPRANVRPDASVVVRSEQAPRGVEKLGRALDRLALAVPGSVGLDVGASTGGFTRALLDRGAARVYAVDVGHGQLLGSLRADPRVVNLERTNVADLDGTLVPEPVDLVVVDVSKLRLGEAVEQLTERVRLRPDAALVGLVKPMFELRLGELPTEPEQLTEAGARAARAIEGAGWTVREVIESEVRGSRGAVELFVHATFGIRA